MLQKPEAGPLCQKGPEESGRASPYNPLANPKTSQIEKQDNGSSIGGYGVFLILKIMDEVTYSRDDNSNVLTLVKYVD